MTEILAVVAGLLICAGLVIAVYLYLRPATVEDEEYEHESGYTNNETKGV